MSVLNQIVSVTAMNLRSVPQRLGSSSVIVIGIAGVVAVILSVFGLTRSLSGALLATGSPDRAIVLRSGATGEISSTLLGDAVATIKDAPGIARAPDGGPAASAELLAAVNLNRKEDGRRAGVVVRGVEPAAFAVRPQVEVVAGRMFKPGLRELLVGRSTSQEFAGVALGDQVALRDGLWTVVGVFTSGDASESSLLADAATLLSAYQRTAVTSVTVRLDSPGAFDEFKAALTTNPTLSVSVERETDFYRRQSQQANRVFGLVGLAVGVFMGLGAVFAALNTMYSAVSARTREIATLRAIGFGAGGVLVSVLVEALALSLLGAIVGGSIAWMIFSGNTVTLGGSVSSIVFEMQITPPLLAAGVMLACAVGLVGGLFPALRAARLPVATALRAV